MERENTMRFKTIVITKKTVTIAACAVLAVLGGLMCTRFNAKTVDVFSEQAPYERILSEGLPDSEEKHFSIKSIIDKIIGFDIDNPQTIIDEYSPVFKGNSTKKTDEPTEGGAAEKEGGEEAASPTEPPMPDKAQICSAENLDLNNATDYNIDLDALCAEELPFKIDGDEPQVLVMHTHTTECYDGDQMNGETERNTDDTLNVVAVGEEICRILEENGIKTLHDKTYHDYPSYQGSYTRALSTVESQLKANPSIKIVLDVHRDAFIYPDGSKLKVECEQNGVSSSRVMLVVGSDSMGLWHENWRENLKFAAKIQNAANIMYPGLMRPINLRTERFNGHTTNGSLILEVGSNGNTLSQAKEGGKYVARAIAAVLTAK